MKITVEYEDMDSLVPEEVVSTNLNYFGPGTTVKVAPTYDTANAYIYFGIQGLITQEQIELYHDAGAMYKTKLAVLRDEILEKLEIELNRVIIDNEAKLG
jgi:hypothetical protein